MILLPDSEVEAAVQRPTTTCTLFGSLSKEFE
jgi:hypothetical protein